MLTSSLYRLRPHSFELNGNVNGVPNHDQSRSVLREAVTCATRPYYRVGERGVFDSSTADAAPLHVFEFDNVRCDCNPALGHGVRLVCEDATKDESTRNEHKGVFAAHGYVDGTFVGKEELECVLRS